jgi:SAM-dependent methyltransferase
MNVMISTRPLSRLLASLALAAGCASAPPQTPDPGPAPASEQADAAAPSKPAHADGEHAGAPGHGQHGHHGHDQHHGQGPLVHRFDDDPEVWAKRFDRPERAAKQKPNEVVTAMKIQPGMEVADIGTGTGYFLPYLSPAVGEYGRLYALDIEPKLIAYVAERAKREKLRNVTASVVKVDDPMLRDGSLDRILIVNTWHHIPDRERYVIKLVEGLKPGGQVWIVDYNTTAEDGPPKEHRLEPGQVAKELASGGLTTRTDAQLLPDQYIVVGTKP